eukprot:s238_g22.t1
MADVEEPEKLTCVLCGLLHAAGGGRARGQKFTCSPCAAADKQLRRGLGSKAELQSLEPEEQRKFFQQLHKEKANQGGSALPWVTVRAQLVTSLTLKQAGKKPLEQCPVERDEALGTDLYKVPIKSQSWSQAHHEIKERILRQEREMTQQKNKKKNKGDGEEPKEEEMDLPARPKAAGEDAAKAEENEEKKALRLAKKTSGVNGKVAMTAAKSVGMLSSDFQSLSKLKDRIQQEIPEGILKTTTETLETLCTWTAACKQALQLAEKPEVQSGAEAQPPLAFDLNEVKMLHKTCVEVQKSLRPLLPAPKSKAKAKAKAAPRADAVASAR